MVIILFYFTIACEKEDNGFETGDSAKIGFINEVTLQNTGVVKFNELVNDSHCPSDVNSVDVGKFEVSEEDYVIPIQAEEI